MDIAILQTVLADYRERVFRRVYATPDRNVRFFAGDAHFDETIKTRYGLGEQHFEVRNHYLLGRRLMIQSGAFRRLLAAEVLIVDLNTRILSTWPLLLARRVLGRGTVVYGHAWPRVGREARLRVGLRRLWWWLSHCVLVYTETEARDIRPRSFGRPVLATNNALYDKAGSPPPCRDQERDSFLYCGRLVREKKVDLLIRAFAMAELPKSTRLCILGDGPDEERLKSMALAEGVSERVEFIGAEYREEVLHGAYARAHAAVSPGYVGLAMTQAHWFGTVILVSRDEAHAPEIEAANEINTVFFETDNPSALARAMEEAATHGGWSERASEIADACRSRYSVESMADSFIHAAQLADEVARGVRRPSKDSHRL